MNDDGACVDHENTLNKLILGCLALPLGDARTDFIQYFEQCIAQLSVKPHGICTVNGNPVYADPDNGIILAAVCGAAGIAVRLPAYFTGKIIAEGAKDYLAYEGGQKRLNTPFSSDPDGWVIADGTQNLADIRRGLAAVRSLIAGEYAMQLARKMPAKPIHMDRPENASLLAYLKNLGASAGSPSPEVLDFVITTLPERAGIKPVRILVDNVMTMAHPDTGVIFAFYHNEYLHVRLPEAEKREVIETTTLNGSHVVFGFSEAGMGWVRFGAFSMNTKSPDLLATAYEYADAK